MQIYKYDPDDLFHLLDAVVHLLSLGSVKSHEAEPDDESDEKLNCRNGDALSESGASADPAYRKAYDGIDYAADAHMDEYPDRHGKGFIPVDEAGNSEAETYDDTADDHLGEAVVFKAEVSAVSDIEDHAYKTEDRKCHSYTYDDALKEILYCVIHILSSYNPRYFLNFGRYVLDT